MVGLFRAGKCSIGSAMRTEGMVLLNGEEK